MSATATSRTEPAALRIKTFVFIVLMIALGSAGDVLLSAGMKQVGEVDHGSLGALADAFWRTFTSGTVWLGIASLILFFVCYMLVLSWADLSFVLPASATSYAIVPLLGYALLGEFVSPMRWAGVALICLGVALVGLTPPSTTGARTPLPQTGGDD
ncbi:MAG TPA: EamA family transporter [Candidatus Acidoferrales bacterium]